MLIWRLTAVNPETVAFTHGTFGSDGDAQPVVVASRSATVVRAWNVVVVFLPLLRSRIEYAPAPVVRAEKRDFPLSRRLTCAAATEAPACVTFPDARRMRRFLFVT